MPGNIYICNKVANFLGSKNTIRQVLAGFLLLVFAFSVTPKQFLHDAIANHKDKAAPANSINKLQLSSAGFMCKCDNLVAESPFTEQAIFPELTAPQTFSVHNSTALYHFYSSTFFFFELRGPPASHSKMV